LRPKISNARAGIIIAIVAVILAATGATIGALIGAKVIKTSSKSSQNSNADLAADGGSGPTSTAPSVAQPTSTDTSSKEPICPTSSDIPKDAQGTWLDTTSWLDLTDFNCTFTDEMVGGLPVVGLNATW